MTFGINTDKYAAIIGTCDAVIVVNLCEVRPVLADIVRARKE